jgi:Anti-sigma factor NepR
LKSLLTGEEAADAPALGSEAMLMNCEGIRNAANEMALVGMAHDLADLKAVRTGIGAELRTLHSGVLREEIPDKIAELLRQLDQQLRQPDRQKDADSP